MSLLHQDRTLLEAFRRGQTEALTCVYRTYSPRVLDYLSRGFRFRAGDSSGRARVEALDLDGAHQETFVRAFSPRLRLAYDGLRPYEAFLFTVARSAAVDTLRSRGKLARESVALDEAPELASIPSETRSPEDRVLESEVRELVRRFLAQRSEEERVFAELRFVQGLSQEQAGGRLELSRQEARTREARLKRDLIAFLESEGWLEAAARTGPGSLQARAVSMLLML